MAMSKKFSEQELDVLKMADKQFGFTGEIDISCPRCSGKLIGISLGPSYIIECENKCGIKLTARGL